MFDHEELVDRRREGRTATHPPRRDLLAGLDPAARQRRFRALVRSDRWRPEAVAAHFGVPVAEVRSSLADATPGGGS